MNSTVAMYHLNAEEEPELRDYPTEATSLVLEKNLAHAELFTAMPTRMVLKK